MRPGRLTPRCGYCIPGTRTRTTRGLVLALLGILDARQRLLSNRLLTTKHRTVMPDPTYMSTTVVPAVAQH